MNVQLFIKSIVNYWIQRVPRNSGLMIPCLDSICLSRDNSRLKNIGHSLHWYTSFGTIPWADALCLRNMKELQISWPQTSHLTRICTSFLWLLSFFDVPKLRGHSGQLNVALFSCFTLTCSSKFPCWLKFLPQYTQMKHGLAFEWLVSEKMSCKQPVVFF